ncbi:hypothetical protein HGM15179_006499 [Zosterops borbonicus]|uniref:Uncharacterized protein n=1 Tax=Zosterops borbonicus TaxID=364589 RepID=A0A8K1GMC9_9PASS|nr:hypothetical protein HGM15179_006499 [Zosterops borbonicus]
MDPLFLWESRANRLSWCSESQVLSRIIEQFVLKEILKTISFHPPAMGRDTFCYPRVLQAPSDLALDTARDEAATASLGTLCQDLTTSTGKNFFLLFNLNLPFSQDLEEVLKCTANLSCNNCV